jgi:hypothetical protein
VSASSRCQRCESLLKTTRVIFEHHESLGDRSVVAVVNVSGDFGPYGVQLDIGHGGEQSGVTEQSAGVEALLEEMTAKTLFLVGAPSDGLFEMLHEGGERAEGVSASK